MQDITEIAEAVRDHCVEAALCACEDAGISGLCAKGRRELANQAMRCLYLHAALRTTAEPQKPAG